MKPGATTRPVAWMTRRPLSGVAEMRAILPSRMPMLRTASNAVSGSMTRPPSITRSYCCAATKVESRRRPRKRIRLRMLAPKVAMIAGPRSAGFCAAAATTENIVAWTANGACPHTICDKDDRGGCSQPIRSRTLAASLEEHWTHTGTVYGVDPGADEGARDLGAFCDCVCRQRAARDAGGFCGRYLRVSGSAAAFTLHRDGLAGFGSGQHSAVHRGVLGRGESAAQADFGGALSEDSRLLSAPRSLGSGVCPNGSA